MADAKNRINLAAPPRSVRCHGGDTAADGEAIQPGGRPSEQRPGHPKSVRTRRAPPPARKEDAMAVVAVAAAAAAAPAFSDALSSVAESCVTANCSSSNATGISDAVRPAAAAAAIAGGGVMMDRFLPAAHAVAVLSPPQCASRKAGIAAARNNHRYVLPRLLLPPPEPSPPTSNALCTVPTLNAADDEDDGDWDARSAKGSSSRRCGLLLPTRCMKSTMLLLNPAPAMRRRRRDRRIPLLPNSKFGRSKSMANPLVRNTRNGQHDDDPITMQSWEEVYINSLRRSARGGGGRKGLGALLSPSPELDTTTATTTTMSPSVRELYLEQGDGGVNPKSNHLGFLLILDDDDDNNNNFSHVSDHTKLLRPRAPKVFDGGKKPRRDAGEGCGYGWPLLLEDNTAASRDVIEAAPLLPPLPSPKSPSESWLSRALPSMSSNPPATSFLGLHVQLKKQAASSPWCSSRGQSQSKVVVVDDHARPRQTRIHNLQKAYLLT
uniref:Uncharacterized protein n=2 Tax=Leersia perrieri TaxID=77586 RepID=A0A0D9WIM0_9ORYZ